MPREHLEAAFRVPRVARGRVEPRGPVHHAPLVRALAKLAMVAADAAPTHAAERREGGGFKMR